MEVTCKSVSESKIPDQSAKMPGVEMTGFEDDFTDQSAKMPDGVIVENCKQPYHRVRGLHVKD